MKPEPRSGDTFLLFIWYNRNGKEVKDTGLHVFIRTLQQLRNIKLQKFAIPHDLENRSRYYREDPGACSEGLPDGVRWYFDKLSRTVRGALAVS
jgi:hypothetical protein